MKLTNQKKEDNKFLLCLSAFAFIVFVKYVPAGMGKAFIAGYILSVMALLVFYKVVLMRAERTQNKVLKYLMVFLAVFVFTSMLTAESAGNIIHKQMILLCVCLCFLLFEKAEWLIIPFSVAAMLLGIDYMFLYGNLLIVLLVYKYMTKEKTEKKYLILALLTAGADIAVFVYLRGWSLFEEIVFFYNFRRLGVFLICFLPYLFMAGFLLKGIFKTAEKKFLYLMPIIGSMTGLPLLLLKNQGGRWLSSVIFFGATIYMMMLVLGDDAVTKQTEILQDKLRESGPIAIMILAYPILFVPLNDAVICRTVDWIVMLLIG